MNSPIVLITDFGIRDHFVGAMKGVILSINPKATIVDITHDVPKFDVWTGGFLLYNAAMFFPTGTIFIAVVDPEVGTSRKIILLKTCDGKFFLAPDNGILTFVSQKFGIDWIREVRNRRLMLPNISSTFHGRDIMAPVAAHLTLGINPRIVGPKIGKIRKLLVQEPVKKGRMISGQIWHIDSFGNLITNIDSEYIRFGFGRKITIELPEHKFNTIWGKTFSDVRIGETVAYFGSTGLLEIAKNRGNLASELKVKTGQKIIIRW